MRQQGKRNRQRVSARKENVTLLRALIVLFGAVAVALTGYLVWATATGGGSTVAPNVTPEVTGAARLKADREKIDLGDIKLGNTTQAAFELSNAGDQPLKITDQPYIEVVEGC